MSHETDESNVPPQERGNEELEGAEELPDPARRRLLRLGAYAPPQILGAMILVPLGQATLTCLPEECMPADCGPGQCPPADDGCPPAEPCPPEGGCPPN